MQKGKKMKRTFLLVIVAVLMVALSISMLMTEKASSASAGGNAYTDYNTYAEAQAAAAKLNLEISQEGNTLLKNDGSLPMVGTERVSVFGVAQRSLEGAGTSKTMATAFADAGFNVNPTLKSFYESGSTTESLSFSNSVKNSFQTYNDLAVVVLKPASGSEGRDTARKTSEIEDEVGPDGQGYGWTHDDLLKNTGGQTLKHALMLTNINEQLIYEVKQAGFKNIVVVINCSVPMELGNLEADAAINGIIWMGRPGSSGVDAVPQIVNGTINPSGKTVDVWYKDFTLDPTWKNVSSGDYIPGINVGGTLTTTTAALGTNTTLMMLDYDEDIYMGYRYTETAQYEAAKNNYNGFVYEKVVTYPFGYGLSYTNFAYDNMKVYTNATRTNELSATPNASIFDSSSAAAQIDKLYVEVEVKNTGKMAGKESVQIYVTAPYTAGGIEKAHVELVGYAKTKNIRPGDSATVVVEVDTQDLASYDYSDKNGNGIKGYEMESGVYTLRAMTSSHEWVNAADPGATYDEYVFNLNGSAHLKLNAESGAEVGNLFSAENGRFNSLRNNKGLTVNDDPDTATPNVNEASQTLMSRSNFVTTYAKSPTTAELTLSQKFVDNLKYYASVDVTADKYASIDSKTNAMYTDAEMYTGGADVNAPWIKETEEAFAAGGIAENWTQAAVDATNCTYKVNDLVGINPFGTKTISSGAFKDKTESQAYETFINQLSFYQVKMLAGSWQKNAIDAIGMNALNGADSTVNMGSTYQWQCAPMVAATWNVKLAELQGIVMGNLGLLRTSGVVNTWWGPGMDTHRNPFGGRNYEYYGQDGVQAGYIAAAVVRGAESRGLSCYIKHAALNDSDSRIGMHPMIWASEQAIREIYFRQFQLALQKGGATGIMGAFVKIGSVSCNNNYNFTTGLIKNEWGSMATITTDIWAGMSSATTPDMLFRSGTDSISGAANTLIRGDWMATSTLRGSKNSLGSVTIGTGATARESLVQYYGYRKAATYFIYEHANTSMNRNGISFLTWSGTTTLTAKSQGDSVSENLANTGNNAETASYTVSSGTLPTGLSLSSAGLLSGTVTGAAGTYTFTVKYTGDIWVTGTKNYSITIGSKFSYDGSALAGAEVGKSFSGYVTYDTTSSVSYTVTSGNLPGGVTLKTSGELSGTPTVSGSFNFTVQATVSSRTYTATYTMVVAPSSAIVIDKTAGIEFRVSGGYIQWKYADINDTNWQNVISVSDITGPSGATGSTGATGATGADGKQVEFRTTADYIQWRYVGDTTWINLVALNDISGSNGAAGLDGKGISSATINDDGELVITYTDSTSANLGKVVGTDGVGGDGKSISSALINDSGELVINYTDGTSSNLGKIVGTDGKDGVDDTGCNSTIAVSSTIAAFAIIAAAAVVMIILRKKETDK